MSKKELNNLNSLISSMGFFLVLKNENGKIHAVILHEGIFCCGVSSNSLMNVRKWIVNKINKIRG